MGHTQAKIHDFRFEHGGDLRRWRRGRGKRPLSTKDSLHVVFKINLEAHRQGLRSPKSYALTMNVIKRYARRFFIGICHLSIQGNHIHILIRARRRSKFHHFFRVVAGQVAQGLGQSVTDTPKGRRSRLKLWMHRPFSRVVRGRKDHQTVRNYIQLNEKEAQGRPYSKTRLKGLTPEQIQELWE